MYNSEVGWPQIAADIVRREKALDFIRESGSKMPADLGGDIYAALKNKGDITPIRRTLRSFIRAL